MIEAEARGRGGDVLLVTGDVKKDWWVTRDGEIPARPRPELVVELREWAGARLYMLTPGELLVHAEKLLEGLQVDVGSVSDLEQLREEGWEKEGAASGWTPDSLGALLGELSERYPSHGRVVVKAAANGGFVDRATVLEVAGYGPDRQLKGFTRPISTVTRDLEEQQVLTGKEPFLLRTIYGSESQPNRASGFRVAEEAVALLRKIFEDEPDTDEGDPA